MSDDDKSKRRNIARMKVEFLGGTEITDAVKVMWDLQTECNADIEATFNGTRIILANEEFFKRFGYRAMG